MPQAEGDAAEPAASDATQPGVARASPGGVFGIASCSLTRMDAKRVATPAPAVPAQTLNNLLSVALKENPQSDASRRERGGVRQPVSGSRHAVRSATKASPPPPTAGCGRKRVSGIVPSLAGKQPAHASESLRHAPERAWRRQAPSPPPSGARGGRPLRQGETGAQRRGIQQQGIRRAAGEDLATELLAMLQPVRQAPHGLPLGPARPRRHALLRRRRHVGKEALRAERASQALITSYSAQHGRGAPRATTRASSQLARPRRGMRARSTRYVRASVSSRSSDPSQAGPRRSSGAPTLPASRSCGRARAAAAPWRHGPGVSRPSRAT